MSSRAKWAVVLGLMIGATPAAYASDAPTQPTDPRDVVLDEALAAIEAHAYNLPRIDWRATQQAAHAALAQTPGNAGLTLAIRGAVKTLGDGHSFYIPPTTGPHAASTQTASPNGRPPIATLDRSTTAPVLAINTWTSDQGPMAGAAATVRSALIEATAAAPCGMVVDLRDNTGGNMWPMIAGMLPLYAPGALESWTDRDGASSDIAIDGTRLLNGSANGAFETADLAVVAHAPRYVAVVWGPRTASAGELTAIGFVGQANVRTFGAPSYGQTSSNWSTRLSNGGLLAVMSKRVRGRNGQLIDGPLVPDEATSAPLDAAQAWLASRCAKPG